MNRLCKTGQILILLIAFLSLMLVRQVHAQDTEQESFVFQIEDKSTESKLETILKDYKKDGLQSEHLLHEILNNPKSRQQDKLISKAYYVMGRIQFYLNRDSISHAYYDSAISIAENEEDLYLLSEVQYHKGSNYYIRGNYITALEMFNLALKNCRLAENYRIMGSAYSLMSSIFRLNGIYDRAIEYTIKSKINYEKIEYTEGYAWSAYLLGRIYKDIKNYQKAEEYFQEALLIYNDLAGEDGNENGVALCLEQIGLLEIEFGNYKKAKETIEKVLAIHSKTKSKYGISNAQKILAQIDYHFGNYQEAIHKLQDALKTKIEINDVLSQATLEEYLALSFWGLGDFERGVRHMNIALNIAIQNEQKSIENEIYTRFGSEYLRIKNYEKAIFYQNKQIEIQNEIISGTANINMEQLQGIYETEQKNSQIAELERQNELSKLRIKEQKSSQVTLIIIVMAAIAITIITYLFYNKLRINNKKLKEVNNTKDKLFSIIAHDLKGPVGAILGLSEFLVEEHGENKYAVSINKSLNETYNLLENLLEWARSQLNKLEHNPKSILLTELIQEVKSLLIHQAKHKEIEIDIRIKDACYIYADQEMVKTIFRNLISNAIKFSNKGDHIIISHSLNDGQIEIQVQDQGIGMNQEELDNLFRMDAGTGKKGTFGEKGTGLGLILVKEIIEKHGGSIWVNSSPGKGTDVHFTIPGKFVDN